MLNLSFSSSLARKLSISVCNSSFLRRMSLLSRRLSFPTELNMTELSPGISRDALVSRDPTPDLSFRLISRCKDEGRLWLSVRSVAIGDTNGRVYGFVPIRGLSPTSCKLERFCSRDFVHCQISLMTWFSDNSCRECSFLRSSSYPALMWR